MFFLYCFQTTFYGKLDQPVYLLVWRDSEAKTFVIEETPPYDGDEEAKEAFMARWEEAVNDEIAEKHPNVSFSVQNPYNFRNLIFFFRRASSTRTLPPPRPEERQKKSQDRKRKGQRIYKEEKGCACHEEEENRCC